MSGYQTSSTVLVGLGESMLTLKASITTNSMMAGEEPCCFDLHTGCPPIRFRTIESNLVPCKPYSIDNVNNSRQDDNFTLR